MCKKCVLYALVLLSLGETCNGVWTSAVATLAKKGLQALATGGIFAGIDHAFETPTNAQGSGAVQIYTGKITSDSPEESYTVTIIIACSVGFLVLLVIGFCVLVFILKKFSQAQARNNDVEMQEMQ
ncbi:unnamed protein product [Orchesella dallaii]|uniref:Uncharacterized protein n=1 Tax=Orchesella dallaii TaxID=48710 RepID=A0ABP1RFR1_9HEXA